MANACVLQSGIFIDFFVVERILIYIQVLFGEPLPILLFVVTLIKEVFSWEVLVMVAEIDLTISINENILLCDSRFFLFIYLNIFFYEDFNYFLLEYILVLINGNLSLQ